jgi:hypothetical protein
VCSRVKLILRSGGECKRLSPMTPKCTFILKLHLCKSLKCLEPSLRKKKSSKLGLQNTIGKILKCRCLKCSRIIHLNLKCMSYDRKKGSSQFDSLSQTPLKQRSNHLQLGGKIHQWKVDFEGYKIFFSCSKKT